jgi:ribosomal protein L11 methyltransferase
MTLCWWRLELPVPPELEESLLWKLQDLGLPRVAIRHRPERPDQRLLQAWLPAIDWPEAERRQLEAALAQLADPFGLVFPPVSWQQQADEDWSSSWKQHWRPDPVGQRLLILPAWLDRPSEHADRLVIRMDPGSAFGTGSHPTTRLCLEEIEALLAQQGAAGFSPAGEFSVADLGCGSGVLGMAALLQGATLVAAADTDALAVRATRANATMNGCGEQLQVVQGSAAELAALQAGQRADLLLCNILAPVLEALCPAFSSLLAPGGVGVLSGLLEDQTPRLQRVLAAEGWLSSLARRQSGWALLRIRRA